MQEDAADASISCHSHITLTRQQFDQSITHFSISVSSFKCYVCAPDEGKPEDMYTLRKSFPTHDIQSCSAFTKSKRHLYLLECPHGGSNGCLTKFEGK